jgi:hypothetical protein
LFVGFPTRYVVRTLSEDVQALPPTELRRRLIRASLGIKQGTRLGTDLTDGLFMTSRDGQNFMRWGEAFIRPGLERQGRWIYGDNYQNWGIVETRSDDADSPNELSVYSNEGYWRADGTRLRRYTLRIDGFVSVRTPLDGGEVTTKPVVFEGGRLMVNFSTSAAGSIRIEIQDVRGRPIDGLSLKDSSEIFGDDIERIVRWKDNRNLSQLAGQPVRLRFVMRDADLFAFRFVP